jgi:hypothetical protein
MRAITCSQGSLWNSRSRHLVLRSRQRMPRQIPSGEAVFNFSSATTGTFTVSANIAGVPITDTETINVTTVGTSSTISTSSTTPLVGQTVNVTVTVIDTAGGQPASGATVALSSSRPLDDTVSGPTTTNASGQATFTVTSNAAGTSTLTALVNGSIPVPAFRHADREAGERDELDDHHRAASRLHRQFEDCHCHCARLRATRRCKVHPSR